jgi:integrase
MDRPWKHPDTGVYYFRKWIPLALRPLLGKTVEKRSLGTKDPQVAKGLHRQVAALVEAEWRHARKAAAAETVPATASLTHKQIQALAGEVYRRRVAAHEDEPGTIERWALEADWDRFARSNRTQPIDAALARARWRPLVDEILEEQGIVLDLQTHRRVMQATLDAVRDAHVRLGRAAEGDYRPDSMADRFPKWEPMAPVAPEPALPFEECWQAYQTRARLAPKTVKRWSGTLRRMVAHAGTDDLARITREQLIGWKRSLLDEGLNPLSVRDAYIASAKALFSFLVSDGKLKDNPAVGIKVIVPKKQKLRGPEFTDAEAHTILSATLAPFSALISPEHAAARRWVPWLCAYLGARVNEMTQLRAEDVCEWHGTQTLSDGRSEPFSCWVVRITPEAGSVKTHEARLVPLHPHLVEQQRRLAKLGGRLEAVDEREFGHRGHGNLDQGSLGPGNLERE